VQILPARFEPRRSRQSSFGAPVAFAALRRTKAENEDCRAVARPRAKAGAMPWGQSAPNYDAAPAKVFSSYQISCQVAMAGFG